MERDKPYAIIVDVPWQQGAVWDTYYTREEAVEMLPDAREDPDVLRVHGVSKW